MRRKRLAIHLLCALLVVPAACAQGGTPPLTGLESKLPGADAWYAIHAETRCVGTAHVTAERLAADGVKLTCEEAFASRPKSLHRFSGVWETGPALAWLTYAGERRTPAGFRKSTWTATVPGTGFFTADGSGKQRAIVDIPADAIPQEFLLLLIPHLPWAEGTRFVLHLPDDAGAMQRATLAWAGPSTRQHRGKEVSVVQVALFRPDGSGIATYAVADGRVLECAVVADAPRFVVGSRPEVHADLAAATAVPAAPAQPPAGPGNPPASEVKPAEEVEPMWTAEVSVDADLQVREGTLFFIGEADYSTPGRVTPGRVFALDAATGRTLWEGAAGTVRILGFVDREIVVLDDAGSMHRLEAASGKESARPVPLFPRSEARYARTASLDLLPDGGLVRTTRDAVKLVRADGKPGWSSPAESLSRVRAAGDLVLVCGEESELTKSPDGRSITETGSTSRIQALDARTGRPAWKIESANQARDGTVRGWVTLVVAVECAGRILYVSQKTDLVTETYLHAAAPETGKVLWTSPVPYGLSDSWRPVHDGTSVYLDGQTARARILRAIDLASGETRWTQEQNLRPLCVHAGAPDGLLLAMATEGKRAHELKSFLVALDPATGAQLWRVAGRSVYDDACAGGGRVFLGAANQKGARGGLRAFRATRTGR